AVARERATLRFHFMRGLPGARDDFADATHSLGITAHHADGAEVVQNIFGRDGFTANAAFGEGDVFGQARIEVMTDHQHVEMFVDGVDRVWAGGIGRAGKNICLTTDADNVRRVTATGTFGMVGVD